jgi:mannitol/fructose-specific phosphotransferase system IIA component (Ntr-type)
MPAAESELNHTLTLSFCTADCYHYHHTLPLLQALADFLEQKRSALPRFYFIGDDDLLEILGQAKNPTVIQEHLKKLFQGM